MSEIIIRSAIDMSKWAWTTDPSHWEVLHGHDLCIESSTKWHFRQYRHHFQSLTRTLWIKLLLKVLLIRQNSYEISFHWYGGHVQSPNYQNGCEMNITSNLRWLSKESFTCQHEYEWLCEKTTITYLYEGEAQVPTIQSIICVKELQFHTYFWQIHHIISENIIIPFLLTHTAFPLYYLFFPKKSSPVTSTERHNISKPTTHCR